MQVVRMPCPASSPRLRKITAPAPSPNSTQVLRSSQSMIVESFSAPMTSTVSYVPDVMNCCPTSDLQNHRACAVAEQHAGAAVLPVNDCGKFFRTDDEHRVIRPRRDELLPDF